MLAAWDCWRSPRPILHRSRIMTNIPLSQRLFSQVIKSIQGRSLHPLSGPPGGECFPNGQPEPSHLPCVAPFYILWHHQEEFGSLIFVPALQVATGCCSITLWLLFHWVKQSQLPPPPSHHTCAPDPWPWWQPSAGPVPLLHCPPEAGIPKEGLQVQIYECWEREIPGARSFSHSLVLWASAWGGHHNASICIPTTGCQRGSKKVDINWEKWGSFSYSQSFGVKAPESPLLGTCM